MMKLTGIMVVLLGLCAMPAFAQPRPPVPPADSRPTVSPYLNLLRGGAPAVNYFGIVRPELQMQQQFGQLQQQLGQTNRNLQGLSDTLAPAGDQPLPATGHAATFNNTLGYFNRMPGGGSGRGNAGAMKAPTVPSAPAGSGLSRGFGR